MHSKKLSFCVDALFTGAAVFLLHRIFDMIRLSRYPRYVELYNTANSFAVGGFGLLLAAYGIMKIIRLPETAARGSKIAGDLQHWGRRLWFLAGLAVVYKISVFSLDYGIFRETVHWSCLLAAVLMCLMPADMLAGWVKPLGEALTARRTAKFWAAAGCAVLVGTLSFMEWQQPFYFTRDDAHSYFMPAVVYAARGLFDDGLFPTWDGYQSYGIPTASLGSHPLTYPVTYVAYALARFVGGNEFLTADIFAWIHFIAGYFFGFLAFRALNVRPSLAAAAALCFTLLGFNLIAGRSWPFAIPNIAWLPALGLSLAFFIRQTPTWRWVLGTAAAIALYFLGNVQMWTYGCMFWGLGIMWVLSCKKEGFWVSASSFAMSVMGGFALILPVLIVQVIETRYIPRGQMNATIARGISNILLPWPYIPSGNLWSEWANSGSITFAGGVFACCFLMNGAFETAYVFRGKMRRSHMAAMCFTLLAVLGFTLAMGAEGRLWEWLAAYPPFSKYRIPFKVVPCMTFFMITSGVLWAEALLRKFRYGRHAGFAVALLAGWLAVFNAIHCESSFYTWADKPYPALLDSQKILQAEGFTTKGRMYPVAYTRSPVFNYTLALEQNYPSLFHIPVTTGYNFAGNLEVELPENLAVGNLFWNNRPLFYREFGVDWVGVSKLHGEPRPLTISQLSDLRDMSTKMVDMGVMDAYYIHDADTKPMAYLQSEPHAPLPYRLRVDGVDIDVSSLSPADVKQCVVANFLYRHWFRAFTDQGEALKVSRDKIGHIVVGFPHAAKMLSIRYSPPWNIGFYFGLALAGLALLLGRVTFRRREVAGVPETAAVSAEAPERACFDWRTWRAAIRRRISNIRFGNAGTKDMTQKSGLRKVKTIADVALTGAALAALYWICQFPIATYMASGSYVRIHDALQAAWMPAAMLLYILPRTRPSRWRQELRRKSMKDWLGYVWLAVVLELLYLLSLCNVGTGFFQRAVQLSCFLTALLIYAGPKEKLAALLQVPGVQHAGKTYGPGLFFWLGLLVIVVVLALLERWQPYYFVQCDTHFLLLPTILQGMRGFFNEGIFPTWNGWLLLSGPTASLGWYCLTNPLMYLSYAIAKYVIHDDFHVIDVFCWIQFMLGYTFSYMMLRALNVRPSLAAAAALCFVLCGYNIISGRAIYFYLPVVTGLPALFWSVAALTRREVSKHWAWASGLAIGWFFHSGNMQLWFYAMIFWAMGVLCVSLCRRERFWELACRIVIAGLTGLVICLPLLVVEYYELNAAMRPQADLNVGPGLSNLLIPWPFQTAPQPSIGIILNPGTYFGSGCVFIYAFFLCCICQVAYLARCRWRREVLAGIAYSVFAILSLVFGLGHAGKLWDMLVHYPPFSHFRIPIKLFPFIVFFMTVSGALFLENLLRKTRFQKMAAALLVCTATGLVTFNALHCQDSVSYMADRPYSPLPDGYERFQATAYATHGRIASFAFERSPLPDYTLALGKNYATYYQIPAAFGQNNDTLDMNLPENRDAADFFARTPGIFYKEYGVDWVTVSHLHGEPPLMNKEQMNKLRAAASDEVDLGPAQALYIHSANTKPLAYLQSDPKTPLPYRIRTDGVDIDVSSLSPADDKQKVVANFLHRHWFRAFTDTGEALSVSGDDLNRIVVDFPGKAKTLSIRYCPPWDLGFYFGLPLIALALLLSRVVLPRFRREKPDVTPGAAD